MLASELVQGRSFAIYNGRYPWVPRHHLPAHNTRVPQPHTDSTLAPLNRARNMYMCRSHPKASQQNNQCEPFRDAHAVTTAAIRAVDVPAARLSSHATLKL